MTDEERNIHLDFFNLVKRHLHNLTIGDGARQCTGYVDSEDQYNLFFDDLKALGFSFSTENSKIHKHSRILFQFTKNGADIQIPYFGSPFQILKTSYMICSQGGSYRPQSLLPMTDHFCAKKRRFSMQPTKKIGCKAFMTVKCIRVFGDNCYKPRSLASHKDGSYESRMIMNRLNKDLLSSSPPTGTLRFIILMSAAQEHNHSIVSTNMNQIIHSKLREEIYRVAKVNSACSVKKMKSHLEKVVKRMFEDKGRPQPHAMNRCYYPTETALRFHMRQAGFLIKQHKRQQKHLEQCIVIQTLKSDHHSSSDVDNTYYYAEEHDVQYCLPEMKYAILEKDHNKKALNQCIVIHAANSEDICNPIFDSDENKEPSKHLNFPTECHRPITNELEQEKSNDEQCIVIQSYHPEDKSNPRMNIETNREEVGYRIQLPQYADFVLQDTNQESMALGECIIITASDVEGHHTYDTDNTPYVEDLSTSLSEVKMPFVAKKRKYQKQCMEVTGTESHVYSNCDKNVGQDALEANLEESSEVEADKNQEDIVEHYILINTVDSEDEETNVDMDSVQAEEIAEISAAEHDLVSDVNSFENEITINADISDVKKLWYQTRENLKVIMRYTYENHTPESVFEIAQLTQQLKNKVLASASASESNVTFLPSQSPTVSSKNTLKPLNNKCINIPTQTVLRACGKYID